MKSSEFVPAVVQKSSYSVTNFYFILQKPVRFQRKPPRAYFLCQIRRDWKTQHFFVSSAAKSTKFSISNSACVFSYVCSVIKCSCAEWFSKSLFLFLFFCGVTLCLSLETRSLGDFVWDHLCKKNVKSDQTCTVCTVYHRYSTNKLV